MIISVARTRKIMGKKAERYTDQQLEEVVNKLAVLADLAIDSYLIKYKQRKGEVIAEA